MLTGERPGAGPACLPGGGQGAGEQSARGVAELQPGPGGLAQVSGVHPGLADEWPPRLSLATY